MGAVFERGEEYVKTFNVFVAVTDNVVMMARAWSTFLVLTCAVLISCLTRESTESHSCGTKSWKTVLSLDEFHSLFQDDQMLIDFYSTLTEGRVTVASRQDGSSIISPLGVFDCHHVEEQPDRARERRSTCFAYGYLSISGVPYRFLFVHKDEIAFSYKEEEGIIEVSYNMTFNKVFDLLISTEKACSKFHKHFIRKES